jgi:hypothetical protein
MAHNMQYTITGTDLKEVARFFSKFTKKSKAVPVLNLEDSTVSFRLVNDSNYRLIAEKIIPVIEVLEYAEAEEIIPLGIEVSKIMTAAERMGDSEEPIILEVNNGDKNTDPGISFKVTNILNVVRSSKISYGTYFGTNPDELDWVYAGEMKTTDYNELCKTIDAIMKTSKSNPIGIDHPPVLRYEDGKMHLYALDHYRVSAVEADMPFTLEESDNAVIDILCGKFHNEHGVALAVDVEDEPLQHPTTDETLSLSIGTEHLGNGTARLWLATTDTEGTAVYTPLLKGQVGVTIEGEHTPIVGNPTRTYRAIKDSGITQGEQIVGGTLDANALKKSIKQLNPKRRKDGGGAVIEPTSRAAFTSKNAPVPCLVLSAIDDIVSVPLEDDSNLALLDEPYNKAARPNLRNLELATTYHGSAKKYHASYTNTRHGFIFQMDSTRGNLNTRTSTYCAFKDWEARSEDQDIQ